MKKQRDSGIELLRIIAMFMVIGVHLWGYGKYYEATLDIGGIVQSSAYFFRVFLRSAVNIFLIISGYFMVNQTFDLKKSFKRVGKTYGSIYFYSIVLSIIALALGVSGRADFGITYDVSTILWKMFFPLSTQTWYFLTDYIFTMLLAPFINLALQKITKKQYQVLLIVLGFIMSVWMYLGNIEVFKPVARLYGYEGIYEGKNVFSFIFMYIIGGYLNLHVKHNDKPKVRYLLFALASLLVNGSLYSIFDSVLGYRSALLTYANPLVILVSVFMFMFFKDLHFKSKIVNVFGGTTLGIYAISEFWMMRAIIWDYINFSDIDCTNIYKNALRIFLGITVVFVGCGIIELLRQKLFLLVGNLVKKVKK